MVLPLVLTPIEECLYNSPLVLTPIEEWFYNSWSESKAEVVEFVNSQLAEEDSVSVTYTFTSVYRRNHDNNTHCIQLIIDQKLWFESGFPISISNRFDFVDTYPVNQAEYRKRFEDFKLIVIKKLPQLTILGPFAFALVEIYRQILQYQEPPKLTK